MDAYPPGSRHPGRRGGRKSGKATGGGSGPGDDQAGGLGTAVFALTLLAMILILAGYILLLVHGGSGAPLCSDRTLSDNMGRVGTGIASLFLVMAFGTVLIPALGLVCCNRTTRAAFGWSMHGSPPPSGRRGDGLASTTGARGGGTADTQSASQASRSTTGTEPAVTGVGHSIDVHDLGTQASAQSDSFVFAFGHVFRYSDPDIQGRLQTCAQPLRVIVEVLVWAQLALFLVAATCACCGFPLLVLVVALGRNAKDQGPDSGAGDAGNESFRAVGEPTWSEAPDHAAMLAGTGSRRDADP
ncbi:hypothetical protein FNF31_01175 [Cafeteria roenbergensis]|uniref:Uncharacterized protein n=1 Tax=Cafeteria roenbergensis TaxID=33653 RepID=A0A5A8DSI2_CAFRO|nr:hypothetical protein FNF31_01175 [Cafeteria roenbergensis]